MYNEIFFELTLICVFFIQLFYYGIGKPLDEKILSGALLFGYSVWLAKRALPATISKQLAQQYFDQLNNAEDELHRKQIRDSYRKMIVATGRDAFTWQKIAGACPICTHFWLSLIVLLIASFFISITLITFIFYFLTGHIINRLFTKWI